jgi:hypothetical protein
MPTAVEQKLLPVLEALNEARPGHEWDSGYERSFEALLKGGDDASVEARVALMDYYVGEAYAEELVCAVARDGPRMAILLELYSRCDIQPSRSSASRDRGLPLRAYALALLNEGRVKESCTYE